MAFLYVIIFFAVTGIYCHKVTSVLDWIDRFFESETLTAVSVPVFFFGSPFGVLIEIASLIKKGPFL